MPACDGQQRARYELFAVLFAVTTREALAAPFHFGPWLVEPATRTLRRGAETQQIEPLAMDVLVALCLRAGEVVSAETLLQECWGTTLHGDNPVHKIITRLRKVLGDNTAEPSYIATIRKRGYRTVAAIAYGDGGLPAVRTGVWREGSPFRGLEAFDERHAALFQGRHQATQQLRRAVRDQIEAGCALQWVLGPSGSGKTSLVQAGLIPALAAELGGDHIRISSSAVFDLGDVDESTLYISLASSLIDWEIGGVPVFADIGADELGKQLADDPAQALADALAGKGVNPSPKVLLFVDRFEALFSIFSPEGEQLSRFMQLLETLARQPQVIVVVACRNDFYPRLVALPEFMSAKARGGHFDLLPPDAGEIAQMIRLPAYAAGLRFGVDAKTGARLDDILCASAAKSADVLPLLQYSLQELYRQRTADNELSVEVLEALGGLEGAIGRRAEETVAGLDAAQQAALPAVLSLIVSLSNDGESVTSRGASLSDLGSEAQRKLVFALVESRLLVSRLHNNVPGFAVAHEALLRRWPRITDWIGQHRQELRVRERVAAQAARWVAEERSADLLLPKGKPVDEALALLQSGAVSLSPDEQALIAASASKAKFAKRLRTGIIASLAALTLLAAVLGINAASARRQAEQRRTEAEGLMGYMLNDFADKMRPLGRLELLDGISAKAMNYLSDGGGETLSPAALTQRAKALQVIGEVRVQRGDTNGAREALLTAHAILERQAVEQPANTEVLKNKGVNAYWLGKIHKDRSQFAEAESYYRQYLEAADRLNQIEPDNPEWWIEQSYGHNNLGSLARVQGAYASARVELEKSLALKKRALERRPDDRGLRNDLADTFSWLAGVDLAEGHLRAARDNLDGGIRMVDELQKKFPSEAIFRFRLAVLGARMAAVQLALGETDKALAAQSAVIAHFAQLNQIDPQNREWQRLFYTHQSTGYFWAYLADRPPDIAEIRQLRKKIDALVSIDPSKIEWAYLAAASRRTLAVTLMHGGALNDARRELQTALQILAKAKRPTANQDIFILHPNILMVLAEVERRSGNDTGAAAACQSASDLLSEPVRESRNYEFLDTWVRAQDCLGRRQGGTEAMARLNAMDYQNVNFRHFFAAHR